MPELPDDCKKLNEMLKKHGEEYVFAKVKQFAHEFQYGHEMGNQMDSMQAMDSLRTATGMSIDQLTEMMNRHDRRPNEEDAATADRAAIEADSIASSLVTKQGIAQAWERSVKMFKNGVASAIGGINNMNISPEMKNVLVQFGGNRTLPEIEFEGKKLHTGTTEGTLWKERLDVFRASVGQSMGKQQDKDLFNASIGLLLSARTEKGVDSRYINLLKAAAADKKMVFPEQVCDMAMELGQRQDVLDFVKAEGDTLASLGRYSESVGVIRKTREGYFPNLVNMDASFNAGIFDQLLFGKHLSSSELAKAKTFRSGVEAAINGFAPVSFDAGQIMQMYHQKLGRRLSYVDLASTIRKNGENWKVNPETDRAESAFLMTADAKETRAKNGEFYKDLGNLKMGKWLEGVYAHPDVYKQWGQKVLEAPNPEGFVRTALRAGEFMKQGLFVFDMYHAKTLGTKSMELGGAFGFFANPISSYRTGLDLIRNYDPHIINCCKNGLTLQNEQFERQFLAQFKINPKTGAKEANLWHQIITVGGWSEKMANWIFHQYQAGSKAFLCKKICETEQFQKWVDKGGEDFAYQNVAKIINNHLGGQNLTALGRSNYAQAFFRTVMLAPDFQESKWKRTFGWMSGDPGMRAAYARSLGIQVAMMGALIPALQAIADEMNPDKPPRTMDRWKKDAINHWMDIEVARSDKGRGIYVTLFGSEKEEIRPLFSLFVRYLDAIEQGKTDLTGAPSEYKDASLHTRILDPLLRDLAHEAKNKESPLIRSITSYMEQKKKGKEMTLFDVGPTPISMAPVAYSALGGFDKDPEGRLKWMLYSIAGAATGTPLSEGRKSEQAKGKMAHKLKLGEIK